MTEKVCKKCQILKYATEFCKSKWGADGLHSRYLPASTPGTLRASLPDSSRLGHLAPARSPLC